MLGLSAPATGALVGFVVGIVLSVGVARADLRARRAGTSSRAEYKASLVIVPLLLALVGAGVGALAGTVF